MCAPRQKIQGNDGTNTVSWTAEKPSPLRQTGGEEHNQGPRPEERHGIATRQRSSRQNSTAAGRWPKHASSRVAKRSGSEPQQVRGAGINPDGSQDLMAGVAATRRFRFGHALNLSDRTVLLGSACVRERPVFVGTAALLMTLFASHVAGPYGLCRSLLRIRNAHVPSQSGISKR